MSQLVVHAMHSYYGRENLPGGRSRRIAESVWRTMPVHVFSLLNQKVLQPAPWVTVERSVNAPTGRALRFAAVRFLRGAAKRRFAAHQFDLHTARRLASLPADSVALLHAWNWLPETVGVLRAVHPAAKLVRDVAIAREYDFEHGEHIATEEKVTDAFISPSGYASGQLISWGIPTDKVFEIPFGVDTERFRPMSRERKDAPNEGGAKPVRFAFAGAVSGRKGIPMLIQAWKRLSLEKAELHLYGTVKPEVQPLLRGTPNVHTYGFVDLTDEIPRNDVFVFPSTKEGSAKAIYEALACGLPVITTPNSGSVVRNEKEGFIVPPEDEAALARAMARLYENAELRLVMGRRARNRALEFTWDRYARSVWETYNRVMSSVRSRAARSS